MPTRRGSGRSSSRDLGRDRVVTPDEADLSRVDHREGLRPGRERARPQVRRVASLHPGSGGGVHAPRPRELRPRPARGHGPHGRPGRGVHGADRARADAVRRGDLDPGVPDRRRRRLRAAPPALLRHRDRQQQGLAARIGGDAPVQPLRAPANHRPRPLSQPRRPAPVHRPSRADLRPAHPRRRRRPGEGNQGHERPPPPPGRAPGSLGQLPVLARRGDRPRVEPPDGIRRLPALGTAAALGVVGVVGQLEKTGCIADYTHIWWDIRLHPRFGTIEVRVMDAISRVEDTTALAAYVQGLVKHYSEAYDAGRELPSYHRILTTENKWLAARYGLEAPVMDLVTGRRNRVPVAQLVRRALREIEPHARELGSERELEGIRDILARGNGADRQLRVFNANRDIVEVVSQIADATEAALVATA